MNYIIKLILVLLSQDILPHFAQRLAAWRCGGLRKPRLSVMTNFRSTKPISN